MNLLTIAWKNITQRKLASSLTGLSVALGVALMVAVLVFSGMFQRLFSGDSAGYDLIVGKKGSEWQIVLNTILRVDKAVGQVPWSYYEKLQENRYVAQAVPLAVSDTTEQGQFPIVGTTAQYFGMPYGYNERGEPNLFKIPQEGHSFLRENWDAVIGSEVARKNNWTVGSTFQMVHSGVGTDDGHIHDEKFTVRGVLLPTGTANDRTAFVNINGFFRLDEHNDNIQENIHREMEFMQETEAQVRERFARDIAQMVAEQEAAAGGGHVHHHGPPSNLRKAVTAILVVTRGESQIERDGSALSLFGAINKTPVGPMAVQPVRVLLDIRDRLIGNINLALLILTILIITVSGISIFVSIYNTMSERRREIGVMRALGAGRSTVFSNILAESTILCVGGGLVGLLLGHGLVFLAAPIVASQSGFLIDPFRFETAELWLLPAMLGMATLVGFLPGLTAYRTEVSDALSR